MKRKLSKTVSKDAGSKRRKTQIAPVKKRQVAVDALPWKTVEVPEMFDDAEGFYGLEEIEGVDIVKDGQSIRFVRFC